MGVGLREAWREGCLGGYGVGRMGLLFVDDSLRSGEGKRWDH